MMRILTFIVILFNSFNFFSQARIVLNDAIKINLNGGDVTTPIYFVVENDNANALTLSGTQNGGFLSGDEYNKLRWRVNNSTGNYNVPLLNDANNSVSVGMNVTTAGSADGFVDFSTYGTPTEKWSPDITPSMVTNLRRASDGDPNNSQGIIDRFWIIDAMSYTSRPSVTLSFDYDVAETTGSEVTAGALIAQRFNVLDDTWNGEFGTDDGSLVENAVVEPSDFFQAWTLSSSSSPLPVELLSFSADCSDVGARIQWETATESNSFHFVLEKSNTGHVWIELAVIQAAGNSSETIRYQFDDENFLYTSASYYRLKQVDFNGNNVDYGPISLLCKEDKPNLTDIILFPNPSNGSVTVTFNSLIEGNSEAFMYDQTGKLINLFNAYPQVYPLGRK